ncbi:hypothetical protein K2173_017468 [Erythroxylum novogranatense]|uniref:Protein TIFY n=1 Tax=Erythroxylum novogranatense TaxID=1862640 RepID=A0AAV8TMS4_9ROSI|nr:hypothetical protein K2173_017468 [Erythroxylum novogranatense]
MFMPSSVEFDGQGMTTRSPEMASFSHKCSLLSQYFKESGSFGDLSLGIKYANKNVNATTDMTNRTVATMNLFPVDEKLGDVLNQNMEIPRSVRPMELFPQQTGLTEDVDNKNDSSVNRSVTSEPQSAQMTIFYAGRVIVIDDLPADKAKEILFIAAKGSSQFHTACPSNPAKSQPASTPNMAKIPAECSSSVPSRSNPIPNFSNNILKESNQAFPQPIAVDVPIARRASLHRFLEKRKDRITARAPYPTANAVENKSWLGLAAQSSQ